MIVSAIVRGGNKMKCDCGTFLTKINDESYKILWCKNCGSILIKYFLEDNFRQIMKPLLYTEYCTSKQNKVVNDE